jgi:tripartite-type tricarboxylate transporter receptor subunit TctC
MNKQCWQLRIAMLLLFAFAGACAAKANDYPSQPVKIIIQAAPGNGPDALARLIADRLAILWKQQALIVNRPGGGGIIAAQAAASAPPDGYTLYMPSASTLLVLPVTHPEVHFDIGREFAPIGLIGQAPMIIAVTPSLGVDSLQGLIALAKQRPGEIFYGALGPGTLPHLTSQLFQRRAGVELTYVPYNGTPEVVRDVMSGQLAVVFDGFGALVSALKSGAVKALAITSATRLAYMPDLPTASETLPDFVWLSWYPLLAPAGTPDEIVEKVSTDLRAVLGQADLQEKLRIFGTTLRPMSPTETTDFIRGEQARWKPVVEEAEIKLR